MPGIFDNKIFNTEVFNKYTQRIPNLRKNELLKSRALVTRNDLKAAMTDQGGVDFMENIAAQVVDYWDEIDQDTILAILKGIFSMTGTGNKPFVDNHTADITKELEANTMGATTLNTAMQRALGDNKSKFSLAIMHSAVSKRFKISNIKW